MNTIVTPMAAIIRCSSDRSCSTSTRSTIDLREDRQHHLEHADDDREAEAPGSSSERCGRTSGHIQPMQPRRLRGLLELRRVVEERGVAGPLLLELGSRVSAAGPPPDRRPSTWRRVDAGHDNPVVLVPVDDRRHRHLVEMLRRRLDRSRRQAELFAGAADRAQARAVESGVDQLPDARQADAAAERARDHRQARRAAVHLVDLLDERDAAAAGRA